MPRSQIGWPAPRIADAIAPLRRCVTGPVGVVGFREPSTDFVLGRDANTNVETIAGWMAGGEDGIAVVEDRWQADLAKALAREGRQATGAPRLRRSLQRDARLPGRLFDLRHRPRHARSGLQDRRALRLLHTAAAGAGRHRPPLPLPIVSFQL